MHNDELNKKRSNDVESTPAISPVTTEKLQMLMASMGNQQNLPVNEEHVTEILAQRRQINGFINEDKQRESSDQRYFLTAGLIFILLISALTILKKPEYFTQVLSLIIGGFGGFGFGRATKKE